ncbi:MAG: hypothetical protein HOM14_02035 [Gammaproteobacteria bacterium]|jgi:hypothetical protein|nr:hypothetical protein [Gammaproteobacteria bacterium]MBT3725490.1 hypothetical protein [Gammaproteobacteria bacterium]MBT4076053.1 hypothetical protein [Gammaproteobacteria bacterium]MBT4195422.1 hypothetical protein [Gammaproteobacteria bacterium]MBT4450704.1 hypothetical protein [Gammaproteobacteria bacterium]
MKSLKSFPIKTVAIVLTISSLFITSSVQAHHNDEYLPLAPLILYNVLIRPQHVQRNQHHSHYQKPRRHSQSHGRYSHKRLIKKSRRF